MHICAKRHAECYVFGICYSNSFQITNHCCHNMEHINGQHKCHKVASQGRQSSEIHPLPAFIHYRTWELRMIGQIFSSYHQVLSITEQTGNCVIPWTLLLRYFTCSGCESKVQKVTHCFPKSVASQFTVFPYW